MLSVEERHVSSNEKTSKPHRVKVLKKDEAKENPQLDTSSCNFRTLSEKLPETWKKKKQKRLLGIPFTYLLM